MLISARYMYMWIGTSAGFIYAEIRSVTTVDNRAMLILRGSILEAVDCICNVLSKCMYISKIIVQDQSIYFINVAISYAYNHPVKDEWLGEN